ncbi:RHG31 protein, partial [Zosterops hypoxanthus]|nr:RHG31 protein [Zosterops hypoxanthus]
VVPYVLKSCAEFIETHGIVDGIYRLSGVTSNIQKLRQEFVSDQCPDLTREVYLQDIHCVGSLCKLYFRELPNPLLTYELYKKFT